MNKVNGKKASFAPVREDGSRIAICYGLKKLSKDLYEWFEVYLPKKQMPQLTFDVVKQAILADINDKVKTAIISGFVWNDKPVWFSEENQLNFSQAVVPVTLKIGEEEVVGVVEGDDFHVLGQRPLGLLQQLVDFEVDFGGVRASHLAHRTHHARMPVDAVDVVVQ